ncbi:nucleolar MIF4G domain-containing protein 1 isoform X2 [Meriones unguiculatus]|uniref:nucleolar MIF4G domain-containing protein 1 isoform X2 n=1 Tax=Meriones unguiculatus TaxID=10047 RepID=UPI00293ECD2B|nr:nucleolar MIF4G domain-containing protein 1 isoform X2 [Meriones unguiculatus]
MGAAGRGGSLRRMAHTKRANSHRGPGGGQGPLKRLRLAVEDFVRTTSESDAGEGRGAVARSRPGGRKSRKELRKEKRHLRKARRLQRTVGSGSGGQEGSAVNGGRPLPTEKRPTSAKATATPAKAKASSSNIEASATQAEAKSSSSKATATSTQAKAKGAPGKPGPATAASRKRALLAANEEEDREIRKLERCLGLNKRKKKGDGSSVPLSFARDGLDYILGALECGKSGGLYESSEEEEEEKVETGQTLLESDLESSSEENEEDSDSQAQREDQEDVNSEREEEAEGGTRESKEKKRVRFAEVVEKSESSSEDDAEHQERHCVESDEKYIPPRLRGEETVDVHKKEELERLKKHVKGLINRLSEPNMASISGQLEELYMAHSRKHMNDTLTTTLMDACVTSSAMPSRLMMEHVLLVSILHHTVGIEVRFMLETMLALKNNDMRKIPGYDPEPVEKLRKLQRALVRSAGSGSETQLRISWDGILNAEQTGRWWIVGSAWSGTPMIDNSHHTHLQKPLAGTVSSKMLELARKQRMNTDVRRNIFCTIMTSEDFLDAFEKLLKLGLKDQQEREIVHILMDCCLQEKTYNPFYAFLASKFCSYERRFQMTFQFSIWDKFRDLENLPGTKFSNLVHLLAHLLKTKSLPLSVLKVVEFSELDKPRVLFLRRVLTALLMETEEEDLGLIFSRVSDNPKLGMLREGLKLFISHFLLKHTQAHQSAEEASLLRERAGLASKSLQGKAILRM